MNDNTRLPDVTAEVQRLSRLQASEKEIVRRLREEYCSMPDGELYITKNGEHSSFYVRRDGKLLSLKKDSAEARRLARKRLLAESLRVMEIYSDILDAANSKLAKALRKLENSGASKTLSRIYELPDIDRLILSGREYGWKHDRYEKNMYHVENLRYATEDGVTVRSKSEKFIGDKLESYGIPYRYEAGMNVGGKIIYPDFSILLGDGSVVIWEHFGLMDDQDYFMRASARIEAYRRAGYSQHTNLICTCEDDMEVRGRLDDIIERFILSPRAAN